MARPRILVTLDTGEELRRGVPLPSVHMKAAYPRAIEDGGGVPILASPTRDPAILAELGEMMDGLVITGGAFDIEPERYGETAGGMRVDAPKPLRTDFEIGLVEIATRRRLPIFGVCGGMQLLNVVRGGTLFRDIKAEMPAALDHEQPTSPLQAFHDVLLEPNTAYAAAVGCERIGVNTTHHQAVAKLGRDLIVLGKSPDGVIEAIGTRDDLRIIGVQWHPELLDDGPSRALYRAWIATVAEASNADDLAS